MHGKNGMEKNMHSKIFPGNIQHDIRTNVARKIRRKSCIDILMYEGRSNQTGTFNFTGIKRDASVAVLHVEVSGKCVLLLTGGAHVVGQPRDR